jgi:hypothetical protein
MSEAVVTVSNIDAFFLIFTGPVYFEHHMCPSWPATDTTMVAFPLPVSMVVQRVLIVIQLIKIVHIQINNTVHNQYSPIIKQHTSSVLKYKIF